MVLLDDDQLISFPTVPFLLFIEVVESLVLISEDVDELTVIRRVVANEGLGLEHTNLPESILGRIDALRSALFEGPLTDWATPDGGPRRWSVRKGMLFAASTATVQVNAGQPAFDPMELEAIADSYDCGLR